MVNNGDAVESIWESESPHLSRVIDVCATQYGFVDGYFTAAVRAQCLSLYKRYSTKKWSLFGVL